jgi:Right handed beta helix region
MLVRVAAFTSMGLIVTVGGVPTLANATTSSRDPVVPSALLSGDSATGSTPPIKVCQNPAMLNGPTAPPAGAVQLKPSDRVVHVVDNAGPNTTFWFSPGSYKLGLSEYVSLTPMDGDTFIGAPGAVITGQHRNDEAFDGNASDVTIEYLTIEDFTAPNNQGVVNHDLAAGWIIEHNTIENNPTGAGVMLGSHSVLEFNCLTHNGQLGFIAYNPNGVFDIVVSNNEISYNDTYGYDITRDKSCGCAGGGKFWQTTNAVVTGNNVHDNQDPGLWVDTDNAGFEITDNYFDHNSAEGLIYEISYNAQIDRNTFVDNAWGEGRSQGQSFPATALYISESGSNPAVPTDFKGTFNVVDNDFIDNWGGVVLWEDADRYCSDGYDTGVCTLINPHTFTIASCKAHLSTARATTTPDYFDGCRWTTENVNVSGNTFVLDAEDIPDCRPADGCGFNGLFSNVGTVAPFRGKAIENDITFESNNRFDDNTYVGPWSFMGDQQGNVITWARWRSAPYRQDAGSTWNPSPQ